MAILVASLALAAGVLTLARRAQHIEWHALGVDSVLRMEGEQATRVWQELIDFATTDDAALVVKLAGRPSCVTTLIETLVQIDPHDCATGLFGCFPGA